MSHIGKQVHKSKYRPATCYYCYWFLFNQPNFQKYSRLDRVSEHIMDMLASLQWLRVLERILFKVVVLSYRAVNGSAPAYLLSYFTRVADVPSRLRLRPFRSDQVIVPSFSLATVGRWAFPVFAANLWNSFPAHLTSSPSLTIFRQRLKTSFTAFLSWLYYLTSDCGPSSDFVI